MKHRYRKYPLFFFLNERISYESMTGKKKILIDKNEITKTV